MLIVITDPYKILYAYEDYSSKTFPVNRDFVSTQYYLDQKMKRDYNAFIFGSSKSSGFLTTDWENYLNEPTIPYHFDASAESLYGIYKKIEFLDSLNTNISNAIIVLDPGVLKQVTNRHYHLFVKHYLLSGQSRFNFYMIFFKSLGHKHFFKFYLDYLLNGKITEWTNSMPRDIIYTPKNNNMIFQTCENLLNDGEEKYYERFSHYFYDREESSKEEERVIFEKQIQFLNEIQKVFNDHHTNFKIIIDPSYNQVSINPTDLDLLKTIFGNENVYNFSGKNKFTENVRNYYESSHYRPNVGNEIMKIIYKDRQNSKTQLSELNQASKMD